MKRSRFSEEQIAYALRLAESGTPVVDVCRQIGVSEATYYTWKKRFGDLGVSKLRRLRMLEAKTSRPKLLSAVGRLTTHSRINTIVLALIHEATHQIKAMIANVRAGAQHVRGAAPQLAGLQRWHATSLTKS